MVLHAENKHPIHILTMNAVIAEIIAKYGSQAILLLSEAALKWGAKGMEAMIQWLSAPTEQSWALLIQVAKTDLKLGQTYQQWTGIDPATGLPAVPEITPAVVAPPAATPPPSA